MLVGQGSTRERASEASTATFVLNTNEPQQLAAAAFSRGIAENLFIDLDKQLARAIHEARLIGIEEIPGGRRLARGAEPLESSVVRMPDLGHDVESPERRLCANGPARIAAPIIE